MTYAHTFVVILAGGGGTRLWPHSRRSRPKQFLPMLPGGETLLGATVRRTRALAPLGRTLVVTTAEQVAELRRCVPELPIDNILIEPLGRNTAPCIGLAAVEVRRRDPRGVLAILPSDHYVADEAVFVRTLQSALRCAAAGHIVTLGISPTAPETGYGYIKLSDHAEATASDTAAAASDTADPVWRAAAFVEKPSAERAQAYLQAGNYVWNSGTFFFPAQRILDELHQHLPALGAILDEIAHNPARTAVCYPEAPAISIDYAVMERLGEELVGPAAAIRVLRGDFGWNDVGSFAAVPELHPADPQKNHVVAAVADPGADPSADRSADGTPGAPEPVLLHSTGNLVWNTGRQLVATLGVADLVIAVTDDVVLVMPRSRAQDVRELVVRLQTTGRGHHL